MKLKFKTVRVCIFSYFHFGFEREHLYLSIPKRRSMFPSSQAITSFYFVQESKCKSPHPLISSFTCCILQRIQTQKQKHTHTLKKVSEVRHRLRKHYYCDHRSPLFAPSRSRVTLMFRVSMHDIIRWFLLLLFKGRLYLENGCLGLD